MRYQIVWDLPHRAERDPNTSLPTVRLPTDLTGQMIPGFTRRQKSDTITVLCRDVHLQKELHRRRPASVKRLEILNIQPRFAVSPFLRSNHFFVAGCRADPRHYFNRGWLQSMPGTSHIEVASHPCLNQASCTGKINTIIITSATSTAPEEKRAKMAVKTVERANMAVKTRES